jgi:hypothetical protein
MAITVAEMRELLSAYPDSAQITVISRCNGSEHDVTGIHSLIPTDSAGTWLTLEAD